MVVGANTNNGVSSHSSRRVETLRYDNPPLQGGTVGDNIKLKKRDLVGLRFLVWIMLWLPAVIFYGQYGAHIEIVGGTHYGYDVIGCGLFIGIDNNSRLCIL